MKSYISSGKEAGGSSFGQRTQEPKTEDPPLSVQESTSSRVKPVGASSNLEDDLEKTKLTSQFNKVLHLKIYYKEESVDPYGKSLCILHGQMDDGTRVLIKRRSKSEITSSHSEVKILRDLKHPGIAGLKCCCEDEKFTYLVLDFVDSPLEEHIRQNGKKTTAYLIKLTLKILEGLNFLHQQNYLHGDVKRENVLVDKEGQPKWFNFSSASPKEMDRDGSKMKDEIYRAGELAYFILSGGENYCGYNYDWNFSELLWDFIKWMTKKGKNLNEVLHHPISWKKYRKLKYLEALGNLNIEVTKKLRHLKNKTHVKFENWKNELIKPELVKKMEQEREKRGAEGEARPYPEDVLGFLRFIRNFLQHRPEEKIDFLIPFSDLFESVYILARDMEWNSRPSVEIIFSSW
ncbi:probable serine/threonine-protein kinase 2 [Pangasianodon hypophthalmus]|uniref:probable serine/threonine-protein kinase 2 n=1 Tax=Pangasianodon hypophthalmus TaxID=310915 RepID=UPI002307759E|nr:probable serine/threonine-protein kinase 2 [Pangasianodon hypophthalmus]